MTVQILKNIKSSSSIFLRILFFHLVLLVLFLLSSCARIEQPRVLSVTIEGININDAIGGNGRNLGEAGAIRVALVVEVTNQNNSEIEFTVQNLGLNLNGQPVGYLVKPETYTLTPEAVSRLKIGVGIDQGVIVGMLLFGQIGEKVTIDVLGDMLIHHSTGDYPVQLAEQHEIRLSDLGL